jgi:hypothetical protein
VSFQFNRPPNVHLASQCIHSPAGQQVFQQPACFGLVKAAADYALGRQWHTPSPLTLQYADSEDLYNQLDRSDMGSNRQWMKRSGLSQCTIKAYVKWVIAQVLFSEILDKVESLRSEVQSMEEQAKPTKQQARQIMFFIKIDKYKRISFRRLRRSKGSGSKAR